MIGPYDHLNADDPITLEVDMDDVAEGILKMNYGAARLAAALIRAVNRSGSKDPRKIDLAKHLKEWLKTYE